MTSSTDAAEHVVKSVGYLPLDISQAASYVKESQKGFSDVLLLYQSDHKYEVCAPMLMAKSGISYMEICCR